MNKYFPIYILIFSLIWYVIDNKRTEIRFYFAFALKKKFFLTPFVFIRGLHVDD